MSLTETRPNKNADGHLGTKCSNCGGYGFTLGIAGTDHGCRFCNQTGVAQPTTRDIDTRLNNLEAEIYGLKNIITKALGKM